MKILSLLLLQALGLSPVAFSQTVLPSEINSISSSVTTVGADFVTVDDPAGFQVGDTVLIIQMKGAVINTPESSSYGLPQNFLGTPGGYEFLIVQQIVGNNIEFSTSNMVNTYDPDGVVQLIKVPYYSSAYVTTTLTAPGWNSTSGTGGVLTMIVGGNLTLMADIDMTGKGFSGGVNALGAGQCVSVDPPLLNRYVYDASSLYSGFKGEGVANWRYLSPSTNVPLDDNFAKGRGANLNGGGGGNGRFSGGGGGGSFGKGGEGNFEIPGCVELNAFGNGGYKYEEAEVINGVLMGGGGGGSTYLTGSVAVPGGRGGGIIIILADTIIGNGWSIKAEGEHPLPVATGEAGAGGGGGGGTIALSVSGFGTKELNLNTNGGDGGGSDNTKGSGGGGGGGRLWTSIPIPSATVTDSVFGGKAGNNNSNTPSESGSIRNDFAVKLNGFLFNSIRSSVTTTVTDSICEGTRPPVLVGTEPVGGTAPYTYLWQKSYDGLTWIDLTNSETPGVNFEPYDTEVSTLLFRRVVTDDDPVTPLVDISKEVTIIVQPLITDNIVGKDTIICFGQDPLELKHYNSGPGGGNGIYSYLWNESTDDISFTPALNTNNGDAYDPPPLNVTKFYQRVITSGRCVDVSNSVEVTVLPLIGSNTIAADQIICENDLFANLTGSVPTGGDDSFTFMWLSRTSSTSWSVATGTANGQDYDPDETEFPETRFFSRVVYSGAHDVCRDTTSLVTLIMHPLINNNVLDVGGSDFQEICFNNQPGPISGTTPGGGDGAAYTYTWQDSTKGQFWTDIPGFIDSDQTGFTVPPLQDSTSYRRIVKSSACNDTSNVIRIYVHKEVTNFNVSLMSGGNDTIICRGALPNLIKGQPSGGGTEIPGDYQCIWYYSEDNTTWIPVPVGGAGPDYQSGVLSTTTYFRRDVISGECSATSNTITITVLPLIDNNIMPVDHMICYNTVPALLNATTPTGGAGAGLYTYLWEESTDTGASWHDAPGINDQEDYQPPALISPVAYRRVVFSGLADCCTDASLPVSIGIYPLPTGEITSLADIVCQGGVVTMNLTIGGSLAAPYTVVFSDGAGNIPETPFSNTNHSVSLTPPSTTASSTATVYSLVSVTDANGCQATAMTGSFEVLTYRNPVPKTAPDDSDEVCGLVYNLTPVPSYGTGNWLSPGVPVVSSVNLASDVVQVEVGDYGTWSFWWREINWTCKDSVKLDVTFWEMPAPVEAGEDILTTQPSVKLNAEIPNLATSMRWSYPGNPEDIVFDDAGNPDTWVSVPVLGSYIFTWTVENGKCLVEDNVTITYNSIPEGFSPDGFPPNDLFEIPGLEETENELVIVNISGAELRRFTNYNSITGYWDGKDRSGKDLPDGTYYYFLTITKPYRNKLSGYVIIKRKLNE